RRPPSKASGYHDNWDLAYGRAKTVMNELVAMGIDPKRIIIGVSAENEPVGRGADPLADSRSARVEVFMLNETVEPASEAVGAPSDQSHAKYYVSELLRPHLRRRRITMSKPAPEAAAS